MMFPMHGKDKKSKAVPMMAQSACDGEVKEWLNAVVSKTINKTPRFKGSNFPFSAKCFLRRGEACNTLRGGKELQ
jgi:hypothetical protein